MKKFFATKENLYGFNKLAIIGDIHGEFDTLTNLLEDKRLKDHLLVFNGDMFDRGPKSVSCFYLIEQLVENKKAILILGNHCLHVAISDNRSSNSWFWGKVPKAYTDAELDFEVIPEGVPGDNVRQRVLNLLDQAYLGLDLPSLRVSHAYWNIELQRKLEQDNATHKFKSYLQMYQFYTKELAITQSEDFLAIADIECKKVEKALKDENHRPEYTAYTKYNYDRIRNHVLELWCSGPYSELEQVGYSESLQFRGGRWREGQRLDWWTEYTDSQAVVIGHHWRKLTKDGSDKFSSNSPTAWFGKNNNVMCVDYSIGRVYLAKTAKIPVYEYFKDYTPALGCICVDIKNVKSTAKLALALFSESTDVTSEAQWPGAESEK